MGVVGQGMTWDGEEKGGVREPRDLGKGEQNKKRRNYCDREYLKSV